MKKAGVIIYFGFLRLPFARIPLEGILGNRYLLCALCGSAVRI